MKVIKRDNSSEEYDVRKIENVLKLAFKNSNTECLNMEEIVKFINKEITETNKNNEDMNIETLQNIIEKTLMIYNYFDTAKHYIEYRNKRNEDRKNHTYITKIPDDIETPWGMLGYITFKRTYARRFNEDSDDTEEYRNTILRVLDASQKQLKVGFTNEELKLAYKYLMSLKCSVAGRFLWQLGTETVDKLGLMSLQNCAFVVIDEPIRPFLWIFDVLMLGTGVGFNIQREYVSKLPYLLDKDIKITRVDTKDADFIVPDSREGWVALLEKVLEAFYYKGKSFTYSTILIRTAGAKIKGFGGTASGPEDLVKGINNIQNILKKRKGQQLEPIDCLDIINIIASVVVAGNVRRCIRVNSLVHTREGLVKIQDIKVGDEVLTSSGYEKVANTFIQGKQNLIKIVTQDGEFECTPNHRMAVVKTPKDIEWKMACELTENDILTTTRVPTEGVKTELPSWCYDNKSIHSTTCKDIVVPELDTNMAWLIGIFQADGNAYVNYKKNGYNAYISLVFGLEEYDMAEKVKEQLQRFGDTLHIRLKRRLNENSYMVHCQSKQMAYYFDKHVKQSNSEIEVPEYIKKAKQEIKLAYIAGIIDGDGCVKGRPLNLVSTVSLKWAKEIQALCYSCGFETRLNIMKNIPKSREGWQPLHKLNIITKHSQKIVSEIPQLFKKFNVNKRVGNSNGFPSDMVINYINDNKINNNNIKSKLGLYNNKQLVIDIFEDNFEKLNYCPTKILKIEDNDEDDTFDIEVENKHEFYCNGYLTHNSALISLGDYDDIAYLKAKDWSQGNIPNWRCMSNNSVVCDDTSKLPKEFWEGYNGTSEPYGLINIELSRKIGRIIDGSKYPDPDVKGYNPCFSADTLIAVADGRGAVSIKQLAEEGKDVPVYSVNEEGMVEIKWGRNPRITGENQKMVKVVLDDNTFIKTTLNHKFILKDGSIVEAKDLKPKMSLTRFNKTLAKVKEDDKNISYIRVNTDTNNMNKCQYFEHRLIAKFHNPDKFNELYDDNIKNGLIKGNVVVHHKDYNGLNNNPDNLEIMTFEEHAKLHGDHDRNGENNGMYGKKHSDDTKTLIGEKTKERCENDSYRKKLSDSQNKLYENNPELKIKQQEKMVEVQFIKYQKWCEEAIKSTNLETLLVDGILYVKKCCENCKNNFNIPYTKRELCYCSIECSNSSKVAIENRRLSRNIGIKEKQKNILHNQIMIYKNLQEKLERNPMKKEWETECKLQKVPYRIRDGKSYNNDNEYLLKSYQELKERAIDYNHRIKSIEFLEDTETVYNITVDDNHTVGIFTTFKNFIGNGIFTPQCGEQSLANKETCCLSEVFLPNIKSFEELKSIATVSYRICKHSLLLKCHHEDTEDIVHKNLRMGIGITGFMQSTEEQKSWLSPLYEYLREYDIEYSKKIGAPTSIKLTTVKPSGTLSLLAGVTSGCHPGIYQYFIRRIRIASNNNLIQLCKSKGYFVEYQRNFDGTDDKNTMVVEFPCMYPIGTKLANEMTAIDQLEMVKYLQTYWSDNAVSCTIYYRLHELEDIKKWLNENYKNNVKTCSFLLHNDHGFQQAPFEEITKEKYEELIKKVIPITSGNIGIEDAPDYSGECAGGVCPIR